MTARELQSTARVLDELRSRIHNQPRLRLHVRPASVTWIAISLANTGLAEHVTAVPDYDVTAAGECWLEELSIEEWMKLRRLVGKRVTADCADLGHLTGTLIELADHEIVLDVNDDPTDRRYTGWTSIKPAE